MLELDLERANEEWNNFDKFLKKIPDACTEDLHIHLNGPGGHANEMVMYLDFFDRYAGNVTLTCEFEMNSADSVLFLFSNTKKELSPFATCMIHKAFNSYDCMEYRSKSHYKDFYLKILADFNEWLSAKFKLILDEEDFAFYETGEDLVLSGEKLRQVTARAEKLFWTKGKAENARPTI